MMNFHFRNPFIAAVLISIFLFKAKYTSLSNFKTAYRQIDTDRKPDTYYYLQRSSFIAEHHLTHFDPTTHVPGFSIQAPPAPSSSKMPLPCPNKADFEVKSDSVKEFKTSNPTIDSSYEQNDREIRFKFPTRQPSLGPSKALLLSTALIPFLFLYASDQPSNKPRSVAAIAMQSPGLFNRYSRFHHSLNRL